MHNEQRFRRIASKITSILRSCPDTECDCLPPLELLTKIEKMIDMHVKEYTGKKRPFSKAKTSNE